MSGLGFFPTPYPDECLYSILCRYFVRGAKTSHQKFIEELFGSYKSLRASVYVPRGLHLLSQWIPENIGITKKMIVENHTIYPYLSVFYPTEMIADMDKYIDSNEPNYDFEYVQMSKARAIRKDFLCFCPECAKEDEILYGETYWHRLPQIQGVLYCPKHRVKIENSIISVKNAALHFRPASSFATQPVDISTFSEQENYKNQYTKLAEDIEWLLKYGLTLGGAKTIGGKYKEMYMEKGGISTIHGRVFRNRFETEIEAFYGEDFLNHVLCIGGYVKNWHQYAVACASEHMRPLHQLLIMNFLCGSPKGFRDSNYTNPYGTPPWPCINRHCSHFGKDGIDEIEFEYDYHDHIGYFRCNFCGMVYRRRTPNHSFDEYIKYATILDYGHLWEKKLRECIFVKKMIQKEIAKEMQISIQGLRPIAAKLNLDTNANAKFVPNRNPRELYQKQILQLLEEQPEISSNDVKNLLSRAYAWFFVNDFVWLQNLFTPEKKKSYWKEKDEKLLSLFQSVYDNLQHNGNNKRRVTMGYLCSLAGMVINSKEQQQVKNQLNLTPKLKHFMNNVLETEEAWINRRVADIILNLKERGIPVTLTHVRKQLTVRQCKFNQYKDFIITTIKKHQMTVYCPYCGSDNFCKDGYDYRRIKKYLCKNPECLCKRFKDISKKLLNLK